MKDHMNYLINNDFVDKPIQIETIIENFNILKRMNMFNASQIEIIFATIISNRLERNSIYVKSSEEIEDLIEILKDCEPFATNMSSFIRFVLINLYSTYSETDLYKAQIMFYKNGEIPMYTYLTNRNSHTAKIDLYVYGITADDYLTKYNLELYYISYEKTHNVLNFVNKF
jgi:hypothetical protein